MTQERDDGQFCPNPSTNTSIGKCIFNEQSFRECNFIQGKVNFDIPLFEGNIDADALDNWLNVLEVYFFVHNFFNREKITFVLLKAAPHVQNWWGTYCEQNSTDEYGMFETNPTLASFIDADREQQQ